MRIAIYCMGADVELSISLKTASSGKRAKSVARRVKVAVDELDSLDDGGGGEGAVGQLGDNGAEETGIKVEDDTYSMDMELAAATETDPPKLSLMSRTNHAPGGHPLQGNEAGKDPLFVTLVHGDMLLLEGDDFEVRPRRGMRTCRHLQYIFLTVYAEKDRDEYR